MPDALLSCSSFKLLGQTYKVSKATPNEDDEPTYAAAHPDLLYIHKHPAIFELPRSRQAQTMLHEMCHIMLHCIGHEDWSDEGVVESLSNAMYEVFSTMK